MPITFISPLTWMHNNKLQHTTVDNNNNNNNDMVAFKICGIGIRAVMLLGSVRIQLYISSQLLSTEA